MSKTLVGIVTFGNLDFTKLTVESIRETTKHPVDFFLVIGKPGDVETRDWILSQPDISYVEHNVNKGFPYSLNDIYDFAWKFNNYDNLIIAGNDVVAYPNCVDELINLADTSDYTCISSLQIDARELTKKYPDTSIYFQGEHKLFTNFSARPWEAFRDYSNETTIADMQLLDIQNFCLYKRDVFDAIGYTDVSFYPAYFVDNDYARRIVLSGLKCCTLTNSRFFHFWSRTIHQGNGGSTDRYFRLNEAYYKTKWGGAFGSETNSPSIRISRRDNEDRTIAFWKSL